MKHAKCLSNLSRAHGIRDALLVGMRHLIIGIRNGEKQILGWLRDKETALKMLVLISKNEPNWEKLEVTPDNSVNKE